MDKQLEKFEEKLDQHGQILNEIHKDLSEVNKTLAVNTESLKYHIHRTNLLESHINALPQKVLIYISILGAVLTIGSKFFLNR